MNKLYVVGLGPGSEQELTPRAMQALKNSEVIFGYTVYVDLLRPILPEKTYISTPMTQEIKRCQMALEKAQAGRIVSMVCSGDAGVYGMAGLLYELLSQYPDVQMEVVPGVTAALAALRAWVRL